MVCRDVSGWRSTYRAVALLSVAVVVALAAVSSAAAGDASLARTVHTWSRTIGTDAHSVALAAKNRHPRRMSYSAVRFHKDALRARAAIAVQHPSSARGRSARSFALRAFMDYARAGTLWAASGRARVQGRKTAAASLARSAATRALAGNRLLRNASKLLP